MSPVIVVASGREIDVVFREGIDLNDDAIEVGGRDHTNAGQAASQKQHINSNSDKTSNFRRASRVSDNYATEQDQNHNQEINHNTQSNVAEILKNELKANIANEVLPENNMIAEEIEQNQENF